MLGCIVLCVPHYGICVKGSFLGVALGSCLLTGVEVMSPSFEFLPILVPVLHPSCLTVIRSLNPCVSHLGPFFFKVVVTNLF